MAVANTKSTAIANRDAVPRVPNPAHLVRGTVYEIAAVVEVVAADDNGSVYRLGRLRSSDRVSQLLVANDAITGGTAFEFGLYETADNGGGVIDADLFASAVDLSTAAPLRELAYEAIPANIDKAEKRLWELLGLSADPQKDYDLAATGTTVGTAAGTIAALIRYCAGN